jgi:hypothetical protein
VKELGLASRIDYSNPGPVMESVSGHPVNSDASIWLTWRPTNGTRTFQFKFHVIDANSYYVIFGMEFLRQNGIIKFDTGRMAPLIEASPESKGEHLLHGDLVAIPYRRQELTLVLALREQRQRALLEGAAARKASEAKRERKSRRGSQGTSSEQENKAKQSSQAASPDQENKGQQSSQTTTSGHRIGNSLPLSYGVGSSTSSGSGNGGGRS